MLRAGRFLWLDAAQAQILSHKIDSSGDLIQITAEHDGYRKLGASHQRTLTRTDEGWNIRDSVIPCGRSPDRFFDLHLTWLLPDLKWELFGESLLQLKWKNFSLQLQIKGADETHLFRAGELLRGSMPADPTWGWFASHYGEKRPALMVVATQNTHLPSEFQSIWRFNT